MPQTKKTNPFDTVNALRRKLKLPPALKEPPPVVITDAIRETLLIEVLKEEFPKALTEAEFVFDVRDQKKLEEELGKRIAAFKKTRGEIKSVRTKKAKPETEASSGLQPVGPEKKTKTAAKKAPAAKTSAKK